MDRVDRPGPDSAARDRKRIIDVYDEYQRLGVVDGQWSHGPATRHIHGVRRRVLEALLGAQSMWTSGSWAVDLGAGRHSELADPAIVPRRPAARVFAVDLLTHCLDALARQPGVHPVQAHAAFLPFASGSIPVVYQSLMLSSVLNMALRRAIYAEVARVIAPGGVFVTYDTRYVNPLNRRTRPVKLRELRAAFPGWRHAHRTLTGLPPLLRLLAPASPSLCTALESVPPLRSHRLFVAEKPAA